MRKQRAGHLGIEHGESFVSHQSGRAARGEANGFDRFVARLVLKLIGAPAIDFVLWNGDVVRVGDNPPVGKIVFKDRKALYAVVRSPSLGFGDAYSTGRVEVEGGLFETLCEAFRACVRVRDGWIQKLLGLWSTETRTKRNTLVRAKDNIHHHYDLGNDFYRLWLDERMVYTCAYYAEPTFNLAQAQLAKMHHVSRKLQLEPGQTVVEAGCGWGALAMHMAEHCGVQVRAFNISRAQLEYAREQAKARGLQDRVEFIEDDYRNVTGRYDAFVSVGMLEHVGIERFGDLGEVITRCLGRAGRGLIHTIGRTRPTANDAWMERRIFPGSYAPCLSEMSAIFEPFDLSILDVENLRLHYRETCRAWLAAFDEVEPTVTRMYDDAFVRAWRLYLAGAAASFHVGNLQLYQVVFAPFGNNNVPMTREHQYVTELKPGS